MNLFDLTNEPISKKNLTFLLSRDKKFKDFISLYNHFGNDGNTKIYKDHVEELLSKPKLNNFQLDNLFNLIIELNIYNKKILPCVFETLSKRINYLTKLNSLFFLLNHQNKIDKLYFVDLNKIAFKSKNDMLKLVSAYNLLFTDDKYVNDILNVLERSKYPTLFYLILNCLNKTTSNKKNKKKLVNKLHVLINTLSYNKEVKKEIKKELEALRAQR